MIEQNLRYLFLLNAVLITAATFRRSVPEEEMVKCHTGVRVGLRRQCNAYRTGTPLELSSSNDFPELPEFCYNITWREANQNNNWGNCVEMTIDDQFRYITSNNVPDYYFNPYCPIGLGYGYCVPQETHCFFPDIICGEDNGEDTTPFGDVWVPEVHHFKIPLVGNPTRPDRPGDMYDAVIVGGPPLYHYHKSPECLAPFRNASIGFDHGARPYNHAQLMAWANDGFGIYAYQDIDGSAPVVDECGGHFGPVDTGEVLYHYHSRPIVPYHLACQGPSLGQCASTQRGTNYCHPGCGADVCIQPGTPEAELREYLATWDDLWLDSYTTNNYKQ